MKKWIASFVIFTLVLSLFVPLQQIDAADTSRAAVISKYSGTVEVKKAGGKKSIKAYKNMNLNQGDEITTGSGATATLLFSNGGSTDDQFVLEENTTITLSKVSNKKGTVTKVKMKEGSAWVDVASIKSSSDEFVIETPTAVMGVRGTNLMISVDDNTANTIIAMFSGVATYSSSSDLSHTNQYVYASQVVNASYSTSAPQQMSNATLEQLLRNATPEVVDVIVDKLVKINEENEKKQSSGIPDNATNADLVSQNLGKMAYALLAELAKLDKINPTQYEAALNRLNTSSTSSSTTNGSSQLDAGGNGADLTKIAQQQSQKTSQTVSQMKAEELKKKQEDLAAKKAEKEKEANDKRVGDYAANLTEQQNEALKLRQQQLAAQQNPPSTQTSTPTSNSGSGDNNNGGDGDGGDGGDGEECLRGEECEGEGDSSWLREIVANLGDTMPLDVRFSLNGPENPEDVTNIYPLDEELTLAYFVDVMVMPGQAITLLMNVPEADLENFGVMYQVNSYQVNGGSSSEYTSEGGIYLTAFDLEGDAEVIVTLEQVVNGQATGNRANIKFIVNAL